ncbi:Hypothetical protein ZAZAV_341 [Cedratvirus Zaza IHUMI]|uniref:Uncharacterized protein n=1 Tax=Cedratvirus Zaza IHUMI TaxID=2126979 RepID=A0A2R8FES4_9VIRU|nr:Hypothetical protein ZAZAV_341 [Cedratvirus Zaza IHUMI]
MAANTLLVFPVLQRRVARGELRFPKINFKDLKDYTFSLSDSTETLNEKLWGKIIEERINLYHLATQCKSKKDLYKLLRWPNKEDFTYEDYRYLDREPLCSTFMEKIVAGYQDIFERDLEAFEQDNFNVDLYAVVLLNRGEYFGHVYCWISPTNPELAFCIGIRSRVDWIFYKSKYAQSALSKVPISSLLFEGVRRFASIKGAGSMIIYQPLEVIRNIAPRVGFQPLPEDLYEPKDIGRSIFNYTFLIRPYEEALIRNTEEPVVEQIGEFVLKER